MGERTVALSVVGSTGGDCRRRGKNKYPSSLVRIFGKGGEGGGMEKKGEKAKYGFWG